ELKQLLWSGVPKCCPTSIRSDSWRIVLGYLPVNRERAAHVLAKKRSEYNELLQHYYEKETPSVDEAKLLRQLRVDIPRTHSGRLFFSHPRIQACMERALFLWAVKNPASGYVQGMNDLITPFLSVFLESSLVSHFASFTSRCLLPSPVGVAVPSSLHGTLSFPVVLHFGCAGRDPDTVSIDEIPGGILHEVEADSFWCLSKLLAHIQVRFSVLSLLSSFPFRCLKKVQSSLLHNGPQPADRSALLPISCVQ
ncbi:TBC domain protein, partial [Toxoplasma gondii FOU]